MKIRQFNAKNVYGYLDFDIKFRDDYTFLIGLNGTGKTSALRLIMALLTPNLADLATLPFSSAALSVADGEKLHHIHAVRSSDSLTLKVDGLDESLELSAAELTLIEQSKAASPPEHESPVLTKAIEHAVSQFIMGLATPMFLGLDRRFISDAPVRDPGEIRRREFLARRVIGGQAALIKGGNVAAGLADVNVLVYETMSQIREKQERLDAEFRNRLLVSAFDFKPAEFGDLQPPSPAALNQYRTKQSEIENAVKSLQIPIDIVRNALGSFFERMNEITKVLERSTARAKQNSEVTSGKRSRRWGSHEPPMTQPATATENEKLVEWMINKPQVDRITAHLDLLATYNQQRDALREPIERFLKLLNQFLQDTRKRVTVSENGFLQVNVGGDDKSIGSLSSGERQLVVMLGHLALNNRLAGSGVFIIDEPELSLHISWQEKFVDSIRAANNAVQIVMATHSPAIILERDDHCESLDREISL